VSLDRSLCKQLEAAGDIAFRKLAVALETTERRQRLGVDMSGGVQFVALNSTGDRTTDGGR
jgi:hypothetical protein